MNLLASAGLLLLALAALVNAPALHGQEPDPGPESQIASDLQSLIDHARSGFGELRLGEARLRGGVVLVRDVLDTPESFSACELGEAGFDVTLRCEGWSVDFSELSFGINRVLGRSEYSYADDSFGDRSYEVYYWYDTDDVEIALVGGREAYVQVSRYLERESASGVDAEWSAADSRRPGQRFRDCEQCPEMVVVPAGEFMMGSPVSEEGRSGREGPRRRVVIAEPFAIGVYEVTFDEWDACAAAGRCPEAWDEGGWGRGRRPVIETYRSGTRFYVEWLSSRTGQRYRLPTEAEWEYAARAGTETARHWGESEAERCGYENGHDATLEEADTTWARYRSTDVPPCRDGHAYTAPVGSFAANPWGLHDVLGNVAEWVDGCHHGSYAGDGAMWPSGSGRDCELLPVRGGSWASPPSSMRSASRWAVRDWPPLPIVGFRVVREIGRQPPGS